MSSVNSVLYGVDLFGRPVKQKASGPVAERFGFPPFSVLDARQGEWAERKRAWLSTGIKSEEGRDVGVLFDSLSGRVPGYYTQKTRKEKELGKILSTKEFEEKYLVVSEGGFCSGTSIFDPVLCECIYRWFSAAGAQVVDPFAGGSVRGIVAGMLGRRYWGCDIRRQQVDANIAQADEIAPEIRPEWVCGDSMTALDDAPEADFLFSCPPYGDLERYSDDPADLSTMEWHTFLAAYSRIILRAVKRLRQDRFACFVVGDFRDSRGYYRDFVGATNAAFRNAGAALYNEAILVTQVGTAAMRVTRQFVSGRKFAKVHQNVLVYCKGDWTAAVKSLGDMKDGWEQ